MLASRLLPALLMAPLLLPLAPLAPARAGAPARLSTDSGVWTTGSEEFRQFLATGRIEDRGLEALIRGSGWTPQELRQGLTRRYPVDVLQLSKFLNSEGGELFLLNQTRSYMPFATLGTYRLRALRSALLADAAADGELSAEGILAALPTDFRLARMERFDGVQNTCAELRCMGADQCTSLLSWYLFLPACLQANVPR